MGVRCQEHMGVHVSVCTSMCTHVCAHPCVHVCTEEDWAEEASGKTSIISVALSVEAG